MKNSRIIKDFENIKINKKFIKDEKKYYLFLMYFKSLLFNLELYIDIDILNSEYIFSKINEYNIISNNNLIYKNLRNFDYNNYENLINLLIFINIEYENLNNSQKWYNGLDITDIFINNNIYTDKLILTLKPFKINNNYKSTSNTYNYYEDNLIKTIEYCKNILISILDYIKHDLGIWLILPQELLIFYFDLDLKYTSLDDNFILNEKIYPKKNESRIFKNYGVKNLYTNVVQKNNIKTYFKKYKNSSPKFSNTKVKE